MASDLSDIGRNAVVYRNMWVGLKQSDHASPASQDGQLPPPVGGATSFTRLPAPASPFETEEMQRPFEPPPPSLVDQITAIPIQVRRRPWRRSV